MKPTFLLIAYDIDKGTDIEHAMRKSIDKNDFQLLQQEFTGQVELNDFSYNIMSKRFASVSFMATTVTYVAIIDVLKSSPTGGGREGAAL